MNDLGYDKLLFILPFDHRSSFIKGMFNASFADEKLTREIKEYKSIIYRGFKEAIAKNIEKDNASILADEQFGEEILKDAVSSSIVTILTTEKSGQKEFTFEYGNDFGEHIKKINPTFAKALIRYNPEDKPDSKQRQRQKLKILGDFCHNNGYKFLIEVLVDPTEDQLEKAQGNKSVYDRNIRPSLVLGVVSELQDAGVEPDVWKMEGMDKSEDYQNLVNQVKRGGRENVGVVVLGRGAKANQVDDWIFEGAKVPGVIGFAVGRTVFWQPLEDFKKGKISNYQASLKIKDNFVHFHNVFMKGVGSR